MPGRAAGLAEGTALWELSVPNLRVIFDPLPPPGIQGKGVRRSLWAVFVLDLFGRLDRELMTAPAVWSAVWPKSSLTRLNFVLCAGFGPMVEEKRSHPGN